MTKLLVKMFISENNVKDPIVREKYGKLSGVVGICCNIFLFCIKLFVGFVSNSVAIMADAFNNLSDAASSIITLIGFIFVGKVPDEEHPFGHGKAEYVSALAVAALIIYVGFTFVKSSFTKIVHPEAVVFNAVVVVILVISVSVKLWMFFFNRKMGKTIESGVLIATAQDSLNDVIATTAVIISMIVSALTPVNIDGYAGLAVALFIMYSGIKLVSDSLTPLIGGAADKELSDKIVQKLLSYDGIVGAHDLIIHNYGYGKHLASVHVEVSEDSNLINIHEVIDAAEKDVTDNLGVTLVIHMDPICLNNERVDGIKSEILRIINEIDNDISMHDFRIVDGEKQINLIFDIVVSHEYQGMKKQILLEEISLMIKNIDNRYNAVITVDYKM